MIGIGSLSGSCLGHLGALLILTLTFNAPLLVCVRAGGLPSSWPVLSAGSGRVSLFPRRLPSHP